MTDRSTMRIRGRSWARAIAAAAALLVGVIAGVAHADQVRGRVTNVNGDPIFNADFNVYDPVTGDKLTPSDKSDATGAYRLTIDPGVYDILCRPVLDGVYAPRIVRSYVVAGAAVLDFVLPPAAKVRGIVYDPTNGDVQTRGMYPCDINFDRTDDGSRQPVLGDKTSPFGTFIAYLEGGSYTVTATPDTLTGFAPVRIFDFVAPSANPDVDVLLLPVQRAIYLNGTLRDDLGAPVAGAQFKFDDANGRRQPSYKHATGADGSYHIGLNPGIYRVTVEPRAGSPYAATRVPDVDLRSTRSLDFTVARGAVVSGRVTDARGLPVSGADWDAILESGAGAATPNDNTELDGRYRYVVAPGLYRLRLTPPANSGLDSVVFRNVPIQRDTTINVDYAALGGGGGGDSPFVRFLPERNPAHTRVGVTLVVNRAIANARIELFDVSGKRVRTLRAGALSAGTQSIDWDGRRENGAQAHTGVYFIRAQLDGHEQVKRFVLLP